jgi:P-type Mg2+ transporter
MLPSQILLNNLLYDSSQLAIPTDDVDPEQLTIPPAGIWASSASS